MRNLWFVLVAVMLMGSDCEKERIDGLDDGFRVDPDTGVELSTGAVPMPEWWDDENLPYVEFATAFWNETMGRDGVIRDVFFVDDISPNVLVSFGYVPQSDYEYENGIEPSGIAYVEFTETGSITGCEIVISSDIAYHAETVQWTLIGEMGHCLGLEDDPNSIDLNSIMSSPLLLNGELTDEDWERLVEGLE